MPSTWPMEVYTDGSRIPGFDGKGYSGIGIWFSEGSPKNVSTYLEVEEATNQLAELMAIDLALRYCRYVTELIIKTDSAYSISSVTIWYKSWERNGWRTQKGTRVMHSSVIQSIRRSLDLRDKNGFKTTVVHVKAHSGKTGNEGADKLAYSASKRLESMYLSKVHFFESGPLSNFYSSPFESDYSGKIILYGCVEQFYQYHKALYFDDTVTAAKILESDSPFMQKFLGGKVHNYSSERWDVVKEDIMLHGLRYKYTQHQSSKSYLISISKDVIAEARVDFEWGIGISAAGAICGHKWKGKNILGRLLTKVRGEIKCQ
jgi:ribA/ribD-fused uncharacterized protein